MNLKWVWNLNLFEQFVLEKVVLNFLVQGSFISLSWQDAREIPQQCNFNRNFSIPGYCCARQYARLEIALLSNIAKKYCPCKPALQKQIWVCLTNVSSVVCLGFVRFFSQLKIWISIKFLISLDMHSNDDICKHNFAQNCFFRWVIKCWCINAEIDIDR